MRKRLFRRDAIRRLALLLTMFIIAGLSGCGVLGKSAKADITVDLSQYVSVTVDGRNTKGKADVQFDTDALLKDLMNNPDKKTDFEDKKDELVTLVDTVSVGLSKWSGLSNGDTIAFEVEFDKSLAAELSIGFKKMDDFTVSGLASYLNYDPFSDVTVTYSGISPYIQVDVEYTCSLDTPLDIRFNADKDYYERGESVILTAEYDEAELRNADFVKISKTENTYKAESEIAYIKNPSDLYALTDMFDYIYSDFQQYITSELADGTLWVDIPDHVTDSTVQSGDITIDSAYLLYTKDEDGNVINGPVNKFVMILKVPFVYREDPGAGVQYRYLAVAQPDIQLDADNEPIISYSDLFYGFPQPDRVTVFDNNIQKYSYDYQVTEIPVQDLPAFPSYAGAVTPGADDPTATSGGSDATATPGASDAAATPGA